MMQLRLLRFLQERTFYPVGEDQPMKVDVRVIAATNADLKSQVISGKFREDLYYRLKVVDIILPPLRDRYDDIPLLVKKFIDRFSKRLDKPINGISDQALGQLMKHNWPGNVRELEHIIERACVLCSGATITLANLPLELQNQESAEIAEIDVLSSLHTKADWSDNEGERILNTLRLTYGNKAQAARILGIDRSTLYRKIRQFDIDLSQLELSS